PPAGAGTNRSLHMLSSQPPLLRKVVPATLASIGPQLCPRPVGASGTVKAAKGNSLSEDRWRVRFTISAASRSAHRPLQHALGIDNSPRIPATVLGREFPRRAESGQGVRKEQQPRLDL